MSNVRIHLVSNINQKVKTLMVLKVGGEIVLRQTLLTTAKNKLRIKKPSRVFLGDGKEVMTDGELMEGIKDDCTILISSGEDFIGSITPVSTIPPTLTTSSYNGILVIFFPTPQLLHQSLSRVHIHYEGGTLKGPLKGVNLPISIYTIWKNLTPLTPSERLVDVLITPDITYLIGTLSSDTSTLLHEWAHARFYLDETYRKLCESVYEGLDADVKAAVKKDLVLWNYREEVEVDEFQAYVVEDPTTFGKKWEWALRSCHVRLKEACGGVPVELSGKVTTNGNSKR
ncbi:hypothetical protein BC829DRAFT_397140 [Chytridium lagenaria]|nr:hypothetical protein BC829DRAFT_397140 [Chytridium lagenaria]